MTTPQPLEIELKLALPPQQAAAFLKRMARRHSVPVHPEGHKQQELVTRYFDTPDFSLSAQGVALRVRRVGRRWVQTLKTEGERRGGLSQRAEYEMAIPRGTPDWNRFPAEALDFVPEALREKVEPVFETRFTRTAWLLKGKGGAQIEVALDVGEVRTLKGINAGENSQPICEIELELKAGRPDALFALALEWAGQFDFLPFDISKAERGVRLAHGETAAPVKSASVELDDGMSVEEGFAAIVQACLAQFQANLPGVLASDNIEYVHQARVALRRLRAALRLYRKVCVLPDELMDGLRTLAAALGPARDWDVLCGETLLAIAPHYPDEKGWQRGMQALEARRTEVRAAMRTTLTQARPGAWLLALQRWLLQHGWHTVTQAQRFVQLSPLDQWARRALQKGHRPIVRGAREFGKLQLAQRHALRIAIKRQRYAAEFFQTLFARRRQARTQAVLRDAQDSLGRANDMSIAWKLLTAAPTESGPMGNFVLGWLAAQQANAADGASAGLLREFLKLKPYW
jgi:inorganic triphosphatase YgiF